MNTDKWLSLRVSKDYNMLPVNNDTGYILWVKCGKCGKMYQWNQLVWQRRHYLKCQKGMKS